ncbi:hypothetical protein K432DRAFT_429121 [Lepidopterella palustris CBS 459.81]|uniref:Uncharacterized protein n=1 Tax=Lepidopterella palustris CBS 459.81 TaxID=1314670 RepID=A0A8E2E2B0_9PEZI|nr:hypothetical protein K432DRAFT_429121 [Lepidopterella palustris CBS 459.81]
MSEIEPPAKARPDTIVAISVIDKQYADLARSSLEGTILQIKQTDSTPFIGLKDTKESTEARKLALNGLRSKMPEILPKLGIGAVDANSLTMGPTLYFTGKYTRVQYPNNSVVCTLAFGPHRDSQVPVGHEVPGLQSGWGCCWAGPRIVEWKGSGGGIGAIVTVPITSLDVTAGSAQ